MPDLWDDLPIELLGDRPPISPLTKQIKRPKETAEKEKGQNADEPSQQVFGSPEVK